MKAKYKAYLEKIGLSSEAVRNNVERIIVYTQELCKEEIIDIFVEDYYTEDGSREYESLWLISERYICEARDFRKTAEYDIDVGRLKEAIIYFRAYIKNYDFKNTTKESRLMIECANDTETSFALKASHENCNKLKEIIDKYIKPNMK